MSSSITFPAQLASIIEVLANAAVAEICKLVDDGYAVLRLEISESQREIDNLRRKLLMTRFQNSRRSAGFGALRRTVHRHTDADRVGRARDNVVAKSRCVSGYHSVEENGFGVRAGNLTQDVTNWDNAGRMRAHHQNDIPVAQDSVSDTQRSELEEGETELPVIKVEIIDSCRIQDIATPGSEKIMVAKTDTSSSLKVAADVPLDQQGSRHRASDTALKIEPETSNQSQNENQKFHHQSSQSKNAKEDQLSAESVSWEDYHYQLIAGNKSQWETYQETENPSASKTGPDAESQSLSEHPEGRGGPGNPGACMPPLGSLDWEPDVVLVDSVPIKVEADMSSEWSLMGQEAAARHRQFMAGADKGRAGVESEDVTHTSEICAPNTQHTIEDRTMGLRSKLLHVNGQSSCQGFSSSSSLKTSRILHPREKQYPLPNITRGLACSSRGTEKQPQISRGPVKRQFRCTLCGKHFPQLAYLRRHERVHTGEKPYGCSHCDKRFSHSHQLKNHERVHTGEKPFVCVYCGKCFTQSSHMKRHLSVHTGNRTFSCIQ